MRIFTAAGLVVIAAVSAGCPGPQTPGARMQEAAAELNTQARFGRLEVAVELVAPAMKDAFLAHRRGWGDAVRIADYEMLGARITTESNADVTLKISWYRPDQQELRVTTLRQHWQDARGTWQLVDEKRADGDVGLIGEPAPPPPTGGPLEPRRRTEFPTVRIGAR
jgi:hypothetical protein